MAPLLFPNLVALALIGLWELAAHLDDQPVARFSVFDRLLSWAAAVTSENQSS
jgi:hypothetical protein